MKHKYGKKLRNLSFFLCATKKDINFLSKTFNMKKICFTIDQSNAPSFLCNCLSNVVQLQQG